MAGAGRGWGLVPAKTWPEREEGAGGGVEDEVRLEIVEKRGSTAALAV